MLRNFHYEPDFDATLAGTNPTVQSSTPTWRAALRNMCDAWCEGLAAHRQYEHLRSRGALALAPQTTAVVYWGQLVTAAVGELRKK